MLYAVMKAITENPGSANSAKTISERAFHLLRRDLLAGVLRPGEKLHLNRLSGAYAVGNSPLREALMRLTAEGLVVAEGQRGFRSAPVSLIDMSDVMGARAQIEEIALRRSFASADVAWEAAILSAFHHLSRCVRIDPKTGELAEEWSRSHLAFHQSLVAACPNQWLIRFWQICYDQADRYRRLAVTLGTQARDDLAEHRAMMEAALARDIERACRLSRAHIEGTEAIVRTYFGATPKASPRNGSKRPTHRRKPGQKWKNG